MPHIVTSNCSQCRYTECVSVCPVECFHIDDEMTYIDPDLCIDCGGCIPVCPVNAIYDTVSMPEEFEPWIQINREKASVLPVIAAPVNPLPGAEDKKKSLNL